MIVLDRIHGNLFDVGERASDLHTKNFSSDMIIKITNRNTQGQYDVPLNLLEARYTAFYGEITNKDIKLALQQSRTRSVDIQIANFKKKLPYISGVIGNAFPENEGIYQEFFPHGVTEYSNANKTTIEVLLTRLKTGVTTHSGQLTPAFVTEVSGFLLSYNTARGVQLQLKDDVHSAVLTKAQQRENLEKEMTKFLHTLAIEFIDTPEVGRAFYNQNLLNPTHRNPKGGDAKGKLLLAIPVLTKVRADFELQNQPDYYLLLENTGTEPVFAYTCSDTTGEPVPAEPFKIMPGEKPVMSYAQLGARPYIFFYIESHNNAGEISITQVDAPIV